MERKKAISDGRCHGSAPRKPIPPARVAATTMSNMGGEASAMCASVLRSLRAPARVREIERYGASQPASKQTTNVERAGGMRERKRGKLSPGVCSTKSSAVQYTEQQLAFIRSFAHSLAVIYTTNCMDRSTSPATVRRAAREGKHQSHTSGLCAGFQQANVVMMPATYAAAFLAFCRANSQPCPILTVFPPGRWNVDELDEAANTAEGGGLYFARGCNVRSDIPMYRVYRHGAFVEERTDVTELFRDDMVTFFLGCSFGFERALQDHGIPVRNIEQHRNVSMYRTTRQCVPVPPFHSPLVVSMRPIPAAVVEQARMLTAEQPNAHGAPVHEGDPLVALGIDQHTLWHAPHFGDAVVPAPDDVPVFWACGVTAILAATSAPEIELVITHAPGAMFVTDVPEQVSYGRVHFSERDRVLSVLRHWQEQQCCKAGWAPVLDVRDSHAFHAAHISNSSSIPLEQLGPRGMAHAQSHLNRHCSRLN